MKLKFLILFQLFSLMLIGQNYDIDLSKLKGGSKETSVKSNSFISVKLKNLILDGGYFISVIKQDIPIIPLQPVYNTMDFDQEGDAEGEVANADEVDEECLKLENLIHSVYNATQEEILAKEVRKLKKQFLKVKEEGSCEDELIDLAEEAIYLTQDVVWEGVLVKGEQLVVLITRVDSDGNTLKWSYKYNTGPRGTWQVSYGFSFISQGITKEENYFTKEKDSKYIIEEKENRNTFSFSPSIFFTWMPTKRLNENWAVGLSGGLGFDFESPTVYFSPTISFNQNLKIHLGLVAHQQEVLLGQYKVGQEVDEVLDASQLHEKLYKVNPFISLSFRFSENPFSRAESK